MDNKNTDILYGRPTVNIEGYEPPSQLNYSNKRSIYKTFTPGLKAKKNEIDITCNVWGYEENPIRTIRYDDFKCLAGGIWKKGGQLIQQEHLFCTQEVIGAKPILSTKLKTFIL